MAIRNKILDNAQPWLEPGEEPQAAFAGQTISGWWAILTYWIAVFKNVNRSVVVTDRRIIVFNTRRWSLTKATGVRSVLDRQTVIGEPSGLWWKTMLNGEKLYVHRQFHYEVRQADAVVAPRPVTG